MSNSGVADLRAGAAGALRTRGLRPLTCAIAGFALVFGFLTRIVAAWRLLEFGPDQARDAIRIVAIWGHRLPTLGPVVTPVWQGSSAGGVSAFSLPPLVYYFVFPFTVFGPDPRWQVLPNSLTSFLTIPLVSLLAYRMLESVERERRFLFSAVAGLWWSLSFADIILNSKEWNPSAIPFFFFALILLYVAAIVPRRSFAASAALWAAYGAVASYLVSLHASAVAVIPPVVLASMIAYCMRNRNEPRRFVFPVISAIVAIALLAPYWSGEAARGWSNSKLILSVASGVTVAHVPRMPHPSPVQRAKNMIAAYAQLAPQSYFVSRSRFWLAGLPFLALALVGIRCFRGRKTIGYYLLGTWSVFIIAVAFSGPDGAAYVHYKLPIIVAPLLMTLSIFAYLGGDTWLKKAVKGVVLASLIVSTACNARYDFNLLSEKFGPHRTMDTAAIADAFLRLPHGATLCVNPDYTLPPALYIDRMIARRGLRFEAPCSEGTIVVRPRYVGEGLGDLLSFGQDGTDFRSLPNPDPVSGLKLVDESDTYQIFRVEPGARYQLTQGLASNVTALGKACVAKANATMPTGDAGERASRLLDGFTAECF